MARPTKAAREDAKQNDTWVVLTDFEGLDPDIIYSAMHIHSPIGGHSGAEHALKILELLHKEGVSTAQLEIVDDATKEPVLVSNRAEFIAAASEEHAVHRNLHYTIVAERDDLNGNPVPTKAAEDANVKYGAQRRSEGIKILFTAQSSSEPVVDVSR